MIYDVHGVVSPPPPTVPSPFNGHFIDYDVIMHHAVNVAPLLIGVHAFTFKCRVIMSNTPYGIIL